MAMSLLDMRSRFQDPMRQGIVDMLWQNSRVLQYVKFIQHSGLAYPYTKRTALPGVGFRSVNSTFTPTIGVINPDVETLTILGGQIRTDSVQVALKGPAARTNEIAAQIKAIVKCFDRSFFNGDAGTIPYSFTGLKKRLGGKQLITNGTNGGPISVNKVLAMQNAVNGPNDKKILFMNQTLRQNLVTACIQTPNLNMSRYITTTASGNTAFNGSEIVEVFMDEKEQPILPFTEKVGTNEATSSVYCVMFGDNIDENGVQGITGLPEQIQSMGPFQLGEFMIDVQQMVVGIGLFGGYVASRLEGVTADPA